MATTTEDELTLLNATPPDRTRPRTYPRTFDVYRDEELHSSKYGTLHEVVILSRDTQAYYACQYELQRNEGMITVSDWYLVDRVDTVKVFFEPRLDDHPNFHDVD